MRKLSILIAICALVAGCAAGEENNLSNNTNNANNENNTTGGDCVDNDGDGFEGRSASCPNGIDCDDSSPTSNPQAGEVCDDRKDNNCDGAIDEGCMGDCTDNDGDGYGVGDCLGPDCDDSATGAGINPGAEDIPNNDIDEDCMGGDRKVAATCMDEDGDGYGAEGSSGCDVEEVDCDDTDAEINPMAEEICDEKDNDCVDGIDNCAFEGAVCDAPGGTCQGGAGAQCSNHDDCAGNFLKCDSETNPKTCKVAEGGQCANVDDCLGGLACDNNTCTGDFCVVTNCPADRPFCDPAESQCVECPYYDGFDVADLECPDIPAEYCHGVGWCGGLTDLENMDATGNSTNDILALSIEFARCFIDGVEADEKDLCSAVFVSSTISRTLTEDLVRDAYLDGDLNGQITAAENEALDDIWGKGLFNLKEMKWKKDLVSDSFYTECVWYEPGGFFGGQKLVLDDCNNYSP